MVSVAKFLGNEGSDFNEIKDDLKRVLDAIQASKEQIIAEIHELERRSISGGITGLRITLQTYDRVSTDEPRLLRVIDDGAQFMGRIIEILRDSNSRSPRFEGALSMLLITSFLRAVAMIERERLTQGQNPEVRDLSENFEDPIFWLKEAIVGVGNIEQRVNCNGGT